MTAGPASGRDVLTLLASMRERAGRRFWTALGLQSLSTLSEGASLVLLLPILQIAEGAGETGLAGRLGLPLPALGLAPLLVAFVGLVALQALLNRWRLLHLSEIVLDFVDATRTGLFDAVSAMRWDALARLRRAEIEHHLMAESQRLAQSATMTFNIIQSVTALVVFTAVAALLSPSMLLLAAAAGALALVVVWPFRGRAAASGERILASRARQHTVVSAVLSGLKGARAMGLEPAQRLAFAEALARTKAEAMTYSRLATTGSGILQVAFAAAAAVFVWASLRVVGTSFATTVLFLVLLVRLAPRITALQAMLQQLMADIGSFRAVRAFEARLRAERDPAADTVRVALPSPRRDIRLDGVTVRFSGSGDDGAAPVEDVSLSIPVGRTTALVGPSGSGKTTIVDVVAGLIAPSRGRVLVDGQPLDPRLAGSWRLGVAYVTQDPVLVHDTLRANLLDAAPGASEAAMAEALGLAVASDIVATRPGGLDAPVGERGGLLSGGERQRVAIAQALLRRPHLLILDEATSGLDWDTQERLMTSLATLAESMTLLLVAHRPEVIRRADLVHVIAGGRVVESGSPGALARLAGGFVEGMVARPA